MNTFNGIGRLGRDPEIRTTKSGKSVCTFDIAINRGYNDEVDWIRCVAWERVAEMINQHCYKGRMIGVTGKLRQNSYEKDGKKYSNLEVQVSDITFCDDKKNNEKDNRWSNQSTAVKYFEPEDDLDDTSLPFDF
jgi:single-strand DNA-binding protein